MLCLMSLRWKVFIKRYTWLGFNIWGGKASLVAVEEKLCVRFPSELSPMGYDQRGFQFPVLKCIGGIVLLQRRLPAYPSRFVHSSSPCRSEIWRPLRLVDFPVRDIHPIQLMTSHIEWLIALTRQTFLEQVLCLRLSSVVCVHGFSAKVHLSSVDFIMDWCGGHVRDEQAKEITIPRSLIHW